MMKLANKPSKVILSIFIDEKEHLPFWIEEISDNSCNIIVKKIKDNTVIEEYSIPNPEIYWNDTETLLKSQGIVIKNNKYLYNL